MLGSAPIIPVNYNIAAVDLGYEEGHKREYQFRKSGLEIKVAHQ